MSTPVTAEPGWLARNRQTVTPLMFLLPGVLFFAVYVIFPVFQSFNISFYKWDGLGEAQYVGISNYEKLMKDGAFVTSLVNNVKWLVLYLLAIPAGLFIALFLNQTVAGIRIYKSLFFFPFVIARSLSVLCFPGSMIRISACSTRCWAGLALGRSTCSAIRPLRPTASLPQAFGLRRPIA